jgi:hypothetical protein
MPGKIMNDMIEQLGRSQYLRDLGRREMRVELNNADYYKLRTGFMDQDEFFYHRDSNTLVRVIAGLSPLRRVI